MMIQDVEFRYLNVEWLSQNTLKYIEVSQNSIPVETQSEGFSIETFAYQHYYPRLGLLIPSDALLHPPYFINSMDMKIELLPIKDPKTNITWWIHTDGWDAKKKYYHTELFRTVGSVALVVQNQAVTINNNTISLTVGDLEEYLQDFKQDLWQIILRQDGAIKGTVSKNSGLLSEESLQYFLDFSDALDLITKNIGVELRETQELRPIKLVRPVNRTFREIASKGFRKQLTSRSYSESYDTPDNRYLHYCVSRVLDISKQLSLSLNKQKGYLTRLLESNKNTITKNESRKSKKIEKDVFDDETKHIENRLNEINIQLEKVKNDQNTLSASSRMYSYANYDLAIGEKHQVKDNCYFVQKINGKAIRDNPEFKKRYVIVFLPEPVSNFIEMNKSRSKSLSYNITGWFQKGDDNTNPEKPFYYLRFYYVDNIQLPEQQKIQRELADRAVRRSNYERLKWEVKLTPDEKKEIIRESEFLLGKNRLFEQGLHSLEELLKNIEPISWRLKKINRFFKDRKIKKSATFPNTMSFVQNHIYTRAKSSFSKINNLDGMDGDLFNSLFEFDQIGIIEIPMLYERWCLLQIIKLLIDVYGFYPDKNWRTMLIQSVINNQQNVEFEFYHSTNSRRIVLTYQKALLNKNNGKYYFPDFVFDIEYQGYAFFPDEDGTKIPYEDCGIDCKDDDNYRFNQWSIDGVRKKRFVIDPKFKDHIYQSGFEEILDDLINNKNYYEDGENPVFVLHPKSNAVQRKTSPLDWGGHSDYGQSHGHQRGFVFLSPSSKHGNTLDNLQRLLGMFLQSTSHFIDYGQKEFWVDTICIACGCNSLNDFNMGKTRTKGGKNSWKITCKNCSHTTEKTFCFKCKRTLYKNQFTWTYHRTKAEQITNVICPSCEEFLN